MGNKNDIVRATEWNKAHPERANAHKRNYNWKCRGVLNSDGTLFTTVDYDRAYQVQQGRCAGCSLHQTELKGCFHADHDHETGIFRFLLCMNCNRALGHAQDSAIILRKLADILEGK